MIWFIHDCPSPGEHPLRCGMDTNIYLQLHHNSPNGYYMWRTPPEMRHGYQHIFSFTKVKSSCLIFTSADSRANRSSFRATGLPCNRTFRATGLSVQHPHGFGSPPNSPLRLWETPMYVPRTSLSLSIYISASSGLSKPPLWVLLLRYVSFRTDPLLSTISTTEYSDVLLTDLYSLQRGRNAQ